MKTPIISILIPTYNREKYISQAIDSVLNQNFDDFEIVCSDNASTDRTYEILNKYAQKDSRIKVYQNEVNVGPVGNWKNCLQNASGNFIHWLWSDDWIEPNFYIDAFQLMKEDGTNIVTAWNYRSDNELDVNDKYVSWQFSLRSIPGAVAAKKILLLKGELPVSPAAYILPTESVRKNFFDVIPKLNDRLDPVAKGVGVDSLINIGSCVSENRISVLRKPSVVFRSHDNISNQLGKDGSLGKMYLFAHLWYLSQSNNHLNLSEFLELFLKIGKKFKLQILSVRMLFALLKVMLNSILSVRKNSDSIYRYKSDKAFFKS